MLLALLAVLATAPRAPALELVVEAPPQLAGAVRDIQHMDRGRLLAGLALAGLDEPGGPIRVVLVPEGSQAARGVPEWIAGYTDGVSGSVTLLPARAASYPHDGLPELLAHEIAHVLVDRAARGRPVPRWFHEGVALMAGREWRLEDRGRLSLAVLSRRHPWLDDLPEMFHGTRRQVGEAYALSGAFVRYLVGAYGARWPARVLARLASGDSFGEAFRAVTGDHLRDAEDAFWRRERSWDRWLPVLTSTAVLWAGITLLFFWVVKRRRRRDAEIRARWEEEERPPADDTPL